MTNERIGTQVEKQLPELTGMWVAKMNNDTLHGQVDERVYLWADRPLSVCPSIVGYAGKKMEKVG